MASDHHPPTGNGTTKEYLLPDLGEGLTEATIVNWLVVVGDTVETDQPVAEVETAKAVVEVPTPFAGTVAHLHAAAGEEVRVGGPLITIDLGGGDAGRRDQAGPAGPVAGRTEQADAADPADGDSRGSVLVGYGTAAEGGGRRRRTGSRAPEMHTSRDPSAGRATAPPPRRSGGRPLAKPPVRKFAKDLGVDLADVSGSGPEGTVTRADVQAFVDARQTRAVAAPTPPRAAPHLPGDDIIERRPLKGVRKIVAERMSVSRREIPEATAWVDCDATGLWELREQLNSAQERADGAPDGVKVSALAIIMRACVAGFRRYPEVNARLDTEADEILIHRFAHLGFAAQTQRGLVVPVIKHAERMSILELAAELARLAELARDGRLAPADMQGGTFTVTNYGSFGVDGGAAVINHPEAAILGVGRISDRPWVVPAPDAPRMQVRKVVQLSIAFDHRICDGAEAAGFLRFVADCVERPFKLLAVV